MAVLVQGQVADRQLGGGARGRDAGPADQAPQPGDDLLQAERLGHVVVATGGDPGDAVLHRVPGGQEQHRDVGCLRAQPSQHLQAVDVGQHDVEHHRVRAELPGRAYRAEPVRGHPDFPALVAQRHRQQFGQRGLVVDDEHPQRGAVRSAQRREQLARVLAYRLVYRLVRRLVCVVGRSAGGRRPAGE